MTDPTLPPFPTFGPFELGLSRVQKFAEYTAQVAVATFQIEKLQLEELRAIRALLEKRA